MFWAKRLPGHIRQRNAVDLQGNNVLAPPVAPVQWPEELVHVNSNNRHAARDLILARVTKWAAQYPNSTMR